MYLCCWIRCTGAAAVGTEFWITTVPVKPPAGWQRNGKVCGRNVTKPSAELCIVQVFTLDTNGNLAAVDPDSHNKQQNGEYNYIC